MLFGTAAGPRLAWHLTYQASSTAYYDAVVDAADGSVLYRQNLTKFASNATVFPNYPGAENDPNPDKAAANTPFVIDFEAEGWVGPAPTELKGPFAHVFTDVNDDDIANPSELVPPSLGTDFQYPFTDYPEPPGGDYDDACEFDPPPPAGWPPPLGTTADCSWDPTDPPSWQVNREQTSTQAFYFTNHFHDHLANPNIGFTDDTGGFGGDGSPDQDDFVIVHANDGADTAGDGGPDGDHINNANMSTPPDGLSPRMQNFLFAFTPGNFFNFRNINGDDDASTVWHEYTHGLSNRLVVNDDGSGATATPHAGAMGEAWSDWYALDLLHREGTEIEDPNVVGEVDIGVYSDATFTTTRFSPADCPVNVPAPRCPGGISTGPGGFTFGDFGKVFFGPEVHSDGEIWLQTLWDLRTTLIAATGDDIVGSDLSEALVTEAMRLSPPEPSFLDMRNSILAADEGITGGAARDLIWSVFAGRGMGFFASVSDASDVTPNEDFNPPPDPSAPRARVTGQVTSADTGLPLAGVSVGFGGLNTDPSFPDFLGTETAANGRYSLRVPAGDYGALVFRGEAGFDTVTVEDVDLDGGETETHDAALRRDWAASAGGATITGSDDTGAPFGCGLAQLIDQSQGAGWSPFNPASTDPENPQAGPPTATITLPQPIDISSFGMDPGNTCGDDPTATTKDFRVETSTDGTNFAVALEGAFAPEDAHVLNIIPPDANSTGVVAVRLTLLSPQSDAPGDSGRDFIDFSELEVFGGAPNVLPSGVLNASAPTIAPGGTVTFDASSFTDPDSAIVGYDWDFDGNGTVDRSTDGPTTEFTYADQGTFAARVFVKDFRGGAGEATTTISVAPYGEAGGPSLKLPRKGKKGKIKIKVDCPAPSCEVDGRLRVSAKTAGKLGLTKRKLADFDKTIERTSGKVKAKIGKRIRRKAKNADLGKIPVKVRAHAVDANGAEATAKGTVKVKP